jgi:hypothetical protein
MTSLRLGTGHLPLGSNMSYPKIVYTPSGESQQALTFVSPPTRQPVTWKAAVRHDNVSTSGVRESVLERVDQFLEINMDWIRAGADLAAWQAFLDHALTGATFDYYADASLATSVTCVLEDTEARLEFKAPGVYSLALKFREAVTS